MAVDEEGNEQDDDDGQNNIQQELRSSVDADLHTRGMRSGVQLAEDVLLPISLHGACPVVQEGELVACGAATQYLQLLDIIPRAQTVSALPPKRRRVIERRHAMGASA